MKKRERMLMKGTLPDTTASGAGSGTSDGSVTVTDEVAASVVIRNGKSDRPTSLENSVGSRVNNEQEAGN